MDTIRPSTPLNQPSLPSHHVPLNLKIVLLVFALALVVVLGYLVWFQNNLPVSTGGDNVIKPKATTSQTSSTGSASTTTANTYTNATYGFSLTFSSKWTGYKVKTVVPTDSSATAYLYFNMPTTSTDANFAKDGPTNLAGYASIFAVGVYTSDQWNALAGTPGQGTKLAENSYYVFDYSPAQDYPTDLKTAYDDIATVIATFKLTN